MGSVAVSLSPPPTVVTPEPSKRTSYALAAATVAWMAGALWLWLFADPPLDDSVTAAGPGTFVVVVATSVVMGIFVAIFAATERRARIEIHPYRIRSVGILGTTRSTTVSAIGQMVTARVGGPLGTRDCIWFLDTSGTPLLSVRNRSWSDTGLDALARAIDIPRAQLLPLTSPTLTPLAARLGLPVPNARLVTAADLRRYDARLIPWMAANHGVLVFLAGLGAVMLMCAAVHPG